jgi:hypothetical protein
VKPNPQESVGLLVSEVNSRGSASGGVANGPALPLSRQMVLKLVYYEPPRREAAFTGINGHLL